MKYELLEMPSARSIVKGSIDRLFTDQAMIKHCNARGETLKTPLPGTRFADGICWLLARLRQDGVIEEAKDIDIVVHKLAHGGEVYSRPVCIDEVVLENLKKLYPLAPLHLPLATEGIEVCLRALHGVKQYAFFETSFHASIPKYAYLYGLPYEWYEKYGVRKYGFHSASHEYVSQKCAALLHENLEDLKIISCHLGSGTSVAAIKGGRSVDISSGLTPQSGTIMSTRPGDFDPFILPYIAKEAQLDMEEISRTLIQTGGLFGISGVSGDLRDIEAAAHEGNVRAKRAIDVFCYQVKKYIGAFAAAMNGVDALIFTGGIGENADEIRQKICADLTYLGIEMDAQSNALKMRPRLVEVKGGRVKIAVIDTNEEYMTAQKVFEIL